MILKENNVYNTIVHPLEPLYDKNWRILILGSFPSVKTREVGFFYGHKQNRFWKVLSKLFEIEISDDIAERRRLLLDKGIAVWDAIYKCDIIASSDSSIKNVVPTDLSDIFEHSDVKKVFCNGNTSYKYYNMYQGKIYDYEVVNLPSTSPANASYSLDKLVNSWKVILEYI